MQDNDWLRTDARWYGVDVFPATDDPEPTTPSAPSGKASSRRAEAEESHSNKG